MKHVFFSAVLVGLLVSCSSKEETSKKEVVSVLSSGESDAELAAKVKQYEEEERIKRESKTTLQLDKLLHDFGVVKPESDNTCKFKVTNTGKKPLLIDKVSASCGCTTPHKPEGPILPGQSDYIEVGFHPKPGQVGEITKTVTIEANTEPILTEVQIKALVK
jgi:hypothetical protein